MQVTMEVDDKLFADAQYLTGLREPSVIVNAALSDFVQREAARQLARMGGSQPQLKRIPRRRMPR